MNIDLSAMIDMESSKLDMSMNSVIRVGEDDA